MDTSDTIHRSECDRVVEEHRLEKALDVARWDREGEGGEEGGCYGLLVTDQGGVEGGILLRLRLTGSCADVVDTFPPPRFR